MRVVAGALRGRRLRSLKGLATRPTLARVRESIFAVLGQAVDGSCVLDLFAGGGSLGIEALSRGAESATFVDSSGGCIRVLRDNLEALELSGRAELIRADAFRALGKFARGGKRFSIIFVDPPYGTGLSARGLSVIGSSGIACPGGWVIVEHSRRDVLPEEVGGLICHGRRRYGDTVVSFYRSRAPES